jgi:glycosyltransferase involved in cell wall biosynthesis
LGTPRGSGIRDENRVKPGESGSSTPTLGLALIVRDEEKTLPNLLESIEGAFDQVVLVDTGSIDDTQRVFTEWAAEQEEHMPLGANLCQFQWIDDFAAARNYADSFLKTDWTCWADADDILYGAENLRHLVAAQDPSEDLALLFAYAYTPGTLLRKVRVVRQGNRRWVGRVDEELDCRDRRYVAIDPNVTHWVHRDTASQARFGSSYERNARILRAWAAAEPKAPRPIANLAFEEIQRGDRDRAVQALRRYLELEAVRTELRAEELIAAEWALRGLDLIRQSPPAFPQMLLSLSLARDFRFWEGLVAQDASPFWRK